jgi:hypothetical protein
MRDQKCDGVLTAGELECGAEKQAFCQFEGLKNGVFCCVVFRSCWCGNGGALHRERIAEVKLRFCAYEVVAGRWRNPTRVERIR